MTQLQAEMATRAKIAQSEIQSHRVAMDNLT
jgi:hypothetical protein